MTGKYVVIFTLLVVLRLSSASLLNRFEEKTERNLFVSCMVNGEINFALKSKPILISLALTDSTTDDNPLILSSTLLTRSLSQVGYWPLLIANFTKVLEDKSIDILSQTIKNYIIYFRETKQFITTLKKLDHLKAFNPHGYYLVVTTTYFDDDKSVIKEVFETLMKYEVLNAVLLITDPEKKEKLNLYGLVPFNNGYCTKNVTESYITLLDYCINGSYMIGNDWYGHKVPKSFTNCELKVAYAEVAPYVINMKGKTYLRPSEFDYHGIEISLIANVFFNMNITLKFFRTDVRNDENSSITLGWLKDKKVDIVIGSYSENVDRFNNFDTSFSYITDSLVWVVPHENIHTNNLVDLWNIVKLEVWLIILLLTVISTLALVAFAHLREEKCYSNWKRATQMLLLIYINVPFKCHFTSPGSRLIVSMILVFALIFSAIYITCLMSFLTSENSFVEKFQNVEDIRKYKLQEYISYGSEQVSEVDIPLPQDNTTNTNYYEICQIVIDQTCFDGVALYRNTAFVVQKSLMDYDIRAYLTPKQAELLKVLLPPIVTFQIKFFMIRGFWGFEQVNSMVMKVFESGLVDKWSKNAKVFNNKHQTNCEHNLTIDNLLEFEEKTKVLYLQDLAFAFYFVLGGLVLATFVFFVEIFIYKYDSYKLVFCHLDNGDIFEFQL